MNEQPKIYDCVNCNHKIALVWDGMGDLKQHCPKCNTVQVQRLVGDIPNTPTATIFPFFR